MQKIITIRTGAREELRDITAEVEQVVEESSIKAGLVG